MTKLQLTLISTAGGKKQDVSFDAAIASFVARHAGVRRTRADLVLEGGGIEVDGRGTAIITESCVLNDSRNPGRKKYATGDFAVGYINWILGGVIVANRGRVISGEGKQSV